MAKIQYTPAAIGRAEQLMYDEKSRDYNDEPVAFMVGDFEGELQVFSVDEIGYRAWGDWLKNRGLLLGRPADGPKNDTDEDREDR
jgi:hypothetical protein